MLLIKGDLHKEKLSETIKLIKYLNSQGIQSVIVSNANWTINPSKKNAQTFFSELCGFQIPYYQGGVHMPYKQNAAAMEKILTLHGWSPQEVVYIGSTTDDMRAARNGKILFLNADWHTKNSGYGFHFTSPKDVARFIDCCCINLGDWFWAIEDGPLRVYSIAPLAEYSKQFPEASTYSTDAKYAVKFDGGNIEFWGRLMAARLHFSGIGNEAKYVAPYPGHTTNSQNMTLANSIKVASGSLSANYLEDFIVRHSKAIKSQKARNSGEFIGHDNQLNTIHLRPDPVRTGPQKNRYVNPPNIKGKTVLVFDDICTQGFSLEAARAFLEKRGAKVINLTWLKTPGGNHYEAIKKLSPQIKKPFLPYESESVIKENYSFSSGIRNADAPNQLAHNFQKYSDWNWSE